MKLFINIRKFHKLLLNMVLYTQNSDSGSKKLLMTEHAALRGSFPVLPSQCQLLRVTLLKVF